MAHPFGPAAPVSAPTLSAAQRFNRVSRHGGVQHAPCVAGGPQAPHNRHAPHNRQVRRARRTAPTAGGWRVGAEQLEGRTLLSSVTLAGGVLTVTGNATGVNRLVVQWTDDHQRFNIAANDVTSVHRFSSVSKIQVTGGSGNDTIYVSPNLPASVKVNIATGGGHDTLTAPGGASINGSTPTPTPAPTPTPSPSRSPTPAPSPTPTPASTPSPTPSVSIPSPELGPADVVGDVGWAPPVGGPGNVAGNPGVTTVFGGSGDPSAPQPVIDVLTQTVYPRTAVHFNGNQSVLGSGDPLTSLYQWDFGDPAGEFNNLTGWSAGHVYDDPGVYTATLTVTNKLGVTSTASVQINVLSDDRRTVYVDASAGNDANAGSIDAPVRSIARAVKLIGSGNVRILLHGDETFGVTQSIGFSVKAPNVYIGSYGGGTPLVKLMGPGVAVQSFKNASNLVVEGIDFDSIYAYAGGKTAHIAASGIYPGGTNTLVRRCTFLNIDYAVNTEAQPVGVMLMDSKAPLKVGVRGYMFWGQGADDVVLNNYDAGSTQEHCLRTEEVERILVADNNFSNHDNKGTIEIHKGSYGYVVNNRVVGGPLRAGPRGQDTEPDSTATVWTVFESNRVTDTQINILPGTYHFVIRNNIIDNEGKMDINISPIDPEGRSLRDLRIFNNTGIDNDPVGQFLYSIGGLPPGQILMGNNLFVAPNLKPGSGGAAPVFVKMPNLSGFAAIFDNVWADASGRGTKWAHGGVNFIWPNYTDPAGSLTPAQWAALPQVHGDTFADVSLTASLTPIGTAAGAALPLVGVFTDFSGRLRPVDGGWSVGALQG